MSKIRIGIVGFGNLGKGVKEALLQNKDMELVGVFSRRKLNEKEVGAPCFLVDEAETLKDKIDVMILCGGSANDLPKQGPVFAKHFNTVDSFDTHAKIPEYFKDMDNASKNNNTIAMISVGWDPGLFSLNRLYNEATLPVGKTYTFWGKGLSQGHSDAIRRVKGVKDGVQYTIPNEDSIQSVRDGKNPELTAYNSHKRECFVVLEDGADKVAVEREIKTMPNYFVGYETTVHFISQEELSKNHSSMMHGGFVLRSGKSANGTDMVSEFSLKLGSNPEFTSSVLVAYARAVHTMKKLGISGAKSVFDVAPAWLSPKTGEELRKELL